MILGIDEVGRGPWAGPLVVGAVVLGGEPIAGLTDSKKLTKRRREEIAPIIYERAHAAALGWVTAAELDEIGMSQALKLATKRAVEQITVPYHQIIIDGTINFLADTTKGAYVTTMPKADLLIPSVSAASVIAKVARDNYMAEQDAVYPGYGFSGHAGYGVAKHRAAIERLGVCPLHRLSFAPLVKYQIVPKDSAVEAQDKPAAPLTTRQIGNLGETEAANWLTRRGHQILARNWRTRMCEIDIVSKKADTIWFTEVKHRKTAAHGDGLAAITPKKIKQMEFAARIYSMKMPTNDYQLRLMAIYTSGEPPVIIETIEL